MHKFVISRASNSTDILAVKALFEAYATELNLDLKFQSFADELSSLPGKYSPIMRGELLLARTIKTENTGGEAIGCVALRSLEHSTYLINDIPLADNLHIGEIKRLYITPSTRGSGLGHELARAIVNRAKDLGYDELRLDTLPTMKGAQNIYERLGFVDVEAYCVNPVGGVRFMGCKLK